MKYCGEHVCMCVSVCSSVHEDIFGTTCVIFKFFVHAASGHGSILFRQFDKIPRGTGSFEGSLSH